MSEPRRATRVAFALAAVAYVAGLALAARTVPGGDEPHYLIIARSLLADGDLRIENNHAQRDYLPYFEGELKPDFLKRSVDGAIYSIHAPGLPVLIALALALFGHRGAMVFLALVSALGTSLAWRLAWQASGSVAAAWFGWAAIAFAAPFFVHAFTVYPDAPAGVIVVVGLLAFVRESTAGSREPDAEPARLSIGIGIAGLALAALPWLHTRYALLAGALGVAIGGRLLVARRLREAAVFLAAPAVSAAGWFLFFQTIYGTPSPAAPYGGYTQAALAFVLPGLTGLLADQQFGLIATAPVLAFAVAGVGAMLFARADFPRARELRLLGLVLLLVCAPYALAASSYRMWWGGFSGPARFLVPLVPALAAPLAVLFARARTNTTRALAIWSLVWTIGFTWILVAEEGGRLAFTTRTPTAAWAMRLAPSVDLAGALPGFFRGPLSAMWGLIAVWAGVATCVWVALREVERRMGLTLQRLVAVWAPLVVGVGAMAALTVAWRLDRRSPLRPVASQAALASHVPAMAPPPSERGRVRTCTVAVPEDGGEPAGRRGVAAATVQRDPRGAATPDEPVLTTPPLPAASWRLRLSPRHPPGEMQVFVSRSATPIVTLDRTAFQPGAGGGFEAMFDIGAAVEGLVIRGWPNPFLPGDVTLAITTLQDDPTGGAVRAVRAAKYGAVAVFFADEKVFPEATGFWVKGAPRRRLR